MSSSTIGTAGVEELRTQVRGLVREPGDPGYDEGRAVWNAMHDRRPAAIVECTGVADVQAGIAFAREHGLQLVARGGGHSLSGASTVDGGLLLDLRPMSHVRVDPDKRIAYAGGGTTWGLFDRETQVHGLAGTGGMISTTGVGGLTLGGGVGRFMRKYGLTCDNLLGAEIVTADGIWRRVDDDNHPDLFWALRGGGGDFGVVTEFEFGLHPLGPIVYGGYLGWPLEQLPDLFATLGESIDNAPVELQLQFVTITAPPVEFVPTELHGKPIVLLAVTWMGDPAEGKKQLAPFEEAGPPAFSLVDMVPYVYLQSFTDVLAPPGRRNYMKSGYLEVADEQVLSTIVELGQRFPTPFSLIELYQMGGAVAERDASDTAFGTRDGKFFYIALACWEDESDDDTSLSWCREVDAAFEPIRLPGRYTNFVADEDDESMREALGPETSARLADVKAKYDPDGVFSRNPNGNGGSTR